MSKQGKNFLVVSIPMEKQEVPLKKPGWGFNKNKLGEKADTLVNI